MSNLYVRVMTGFYTHRKTAKLRVALGNDAFWIPPKLWAYAAENQPDGDLSGYEAEQLAMLLGCSSNAQAMLQALKEAGFIGTDGKIHGWEEHNGYHKSYSTRAKLAADARWEAVRAKKEKNQKKELSTGNRKQESGDKHCSSNACSINEVSEFFQSIGLPLSDAEYFFHKCEGNGWTNAGKPIKNWKATVRAWKSASYLPSLKPGAFKKQPETNQLKEVINIKLL